MQLRGSRVALTLSLACGLGALSAPFAFAGAKGHGHEKTVVRIGALVDQTGPSTSPLFKSAVELAAAQMNEALEKRHSRLEIEVVFGDTKGTVPATAQAEALRLINEEGVQALVSDSSGDTVAVNKLNYDPVLLRVHQQPGHRRGRPADSGGGTRRGQLALSGVLQRQLRGGCPGSNGSPAGERR